MRNCIIIAEVGVNHNGSIELAKKHIIAAKKAGADYVKFQTFKTEKLVTKKGAKANYQRINDGDNESQFEMLKKLELSDHDFIELNKFCEEIAIKFLSTGFDLDSLDFLNDTIKQNIFKIPSGEITNFPYLRKVASFQKQVIMSTGMATLLDIKKAVKVLQKFGCPINDITILHCNTAYPTPYKDVNLNAMNYIKNKLGTKIGYSDHTEGIEIPIAAVAIGAQVIEKHFTYDKNALGPDHKASLDFDELQRMVKSIRNIEKALSGNGIKTISDSEKSNLNIARKGIYTKSPKNKGEIITESDIIALRPLIDNGISAIDWNKVIGKKLKKNHKIDQPLSFKNLV